MFKSLFFRRLYLTYLLVIVLIAVAVGLIGATRLRAAHTQQARQLLRSTATVILEPLRGDLQANDLASLQQNVQRIGSELGYRITVIGPDERGTVLADSEADPQTMEPHRTRPEVMMAFTVGEGWNLRRSHTLGSEQIYYARRINIGSQVAYVRLAIHFQDLNATLRTFYAHIAEATLACMVLAAAVAYYLARQRASAVVELTEFARALARGQLESRILRSDKGELGVLAHSLNSMADSFTRLLEEARRGRDELQAILASMSEGIIATDGQHRILLVNEAAGNLLQFSTAGSTGKLLWELVQSEQLIKACEEVIATRERRQFLFSTLPGRNLDITLCPLRYTSVGQEPSGLIVVIHDVTQAMRYQELRREFVANVSHELRTPLTAIKGYIETLRDGAIDDQLKRDEYLAIVERHATQLGNLVDDLLELSRLEHQSTIPRRSGVDLCALVRRVVDLLAPAIAGKQHHVELHLPQSSPPLVGNADYLERAIANLLDNAAKYTSAGGTISIVVRSDAMHAIIEVADNGIGIPADDIPRIFERFYRVDRSRSREMGGTGLGLSIVKHIVQVHGGAVSVTSTPGVGSRFCIQLPLAAEACGQSTTSAE